MSNEFWIALNRLISESEIIIDRPKGSKHPVFGFTYEHDYGYLADTSSGDGQGIDIWKGSMHGKGVDAIICTVDSLKRDSEIKILIDCSDEEKKSILAFHNNSEKMKGILVLKQ